MGQALSEPVTTKETTSCGNDLYRVGVSSMQGWRIHMEDAHTCFLHLPGDHNTAYFAVFDGHGGTKVAEFAGENLHKKLLEQPEYAKGDIIEATRKAFLALDMAMLEEPELRDELAGSTGIVVTVRDGKICCGNAGDSRAVACCRGKAELLSFDHKPSQQLEKERIVAAGGWVEFNRVNGNLALSRALGDFVFKKNGLKKAEEQIVTANPDVLVRDLIDDHEFIVIACDGIWDVLTSQEVVTFIRVRLAEGMDIELICEELLMRCLAPDSKNGGLGCDNMTVIIVCFLHGEPPEMLCKRCSRPNPAGYAADVFGPVDQP